jgi:hypothetical protein
MSVTGALQQLRFWSLSIAAVMGGCTGTETAAGRDTGPRPDGPIADGRAVDAGSPSASSTRIYAAFVSHNEVYDQKCPPCDPVVTQQDPYLANRKLVVKFAQMIREHKAAWDMQSDWQFVEAATQWDTPEVKAETGGKHIIQYLTEVAPDRIVVDAHSHEVKYNLADLVFILEGAGWKRNGVVGGFVYSPPEQEGWGRFRAPVQGRVYPDVTWTADTLWGGATPGHTNGDSVASGIWRPKDANHFYEDDPRQSLVNVGDYGSKVEELVDLLRAGKLQQNRMYTVTVFLNQCTLSDAEIARHAALVDRLAPEVEAGRLVWATLPDMVKTWRQSYNSTPVVLRPEGGSDAGSPKPPGGSDAGAPGGSCGDAGSCPPNTVCCAPPLPCGGRCVVDCRLSGTSCPDQAPTCDQTTGICR